VSCSVEIVPEIIHHADYEKATEVAKQLIAQG